MSQSPLLPQVLQNLILDEVIATIECTEAERQQLCQQLRSETTYRTWLQQQGVTSEEFEAWLDRELAIRKFQQQQWGRMLLSYFLQRKHQLDRVVCSLIYLQDLAMAQELYFRILEGEQSFAEIARTYSQGAEAADGGRVGPIKLGELHPDLARLFYGSRPGSLWQPIAIDQWIVIARLEEWLPVQLDESMCQMLLNELLEAWLQEQVMHRFPT
jgi:parvulin-like peptidyl-prolyl isomerase